MPISPCGARREWPKALGSTGPRRVCRACHTPGASFRRIFRVSTDSPSAAGSPPKPSQKRSQNPTSKKIAFSAPNGSPTDPQGNPKIPLRKLSKTHLRKSNEKVAKKSPNLTPSTCLNCVRGLKNHTFRVFEKNLQIDVQKPSFWKPFGVQNRKKVVLGRYQKKHQKQVPKKSSPGSTKTPNPDQIQSHFEHIFNTSFQGRSPVPPG